MKDIKICMSRAKCLLETKALVINSKSTDKIRSSSMCVPPKKKSLAVPVVEERLKVKVKVANLKNPVSENWTSIF